MKVRYKSFETTYISNYHFSEILLRSAQSLFARKDEENDAAGVEPDAHGEENGSFINDKTSCPILVPKNTVTLSASKAHLGISRAEWLKLPADEKRQKLGTLGLSFLRLDGISDALDPVLFSGKL